MCFHLYAGTSKPIPRRSFRQESPDISVSSLTEHDEAVRAYFSAPEVQYVGSTSCCGCDFPSLMFQNGDWPVWPPVETDKEQLASDRLNRELLAGLLRSTGEGVVELYGVWEGDFAKEPRIREDIPLTSILADEFYFKERGFYRVSL
jgi:hypothetical protein